MTNTKQDKEQITPFKISYIKSMLQYGDITKIAQHFNLSERKIQYALKADAIIDNNREIINYTLSMIEEREKAKAETLKKAKRLFLKNENQ
jgi:hypothetical protein